jgi:copper oxidase (laccase) domain-containing protein
MEQEYINDGVVRSKLMAGQGLIHATSTKNLGNMSYARDHDGSAQDNFAQLMTAMEVDTEMYSILFPKLTHSCNVALVAAMPGRTGRVLIDQHSPEVLRLATFAGIDPPADFISAPEMGIDACISNSPATLLAVLPADCAPVMLFDPVSNSYALIHAGVLGTLSGIVSNCVECMLEWCNTRVTDLVCYVGPCVSADIYNLTSSGLWQAVLKGRVDQAVATSFDLRQTIAGQLRQLGVPAAQIETSRFCTGRDATLFFSNYSAKTQEEKRQQGRHISLLGRPA